MNIYPRNKENIYILDHRTVLLLLGICFLGLLFLYFELAIHFINVVEVIRQRFDSIGGASPAVHANIRLNAFLQVKLTFT